MFTDVSFRSHNNNLIACTDRKDDKNSSAAENDTNKIILQPPDEIARRLQTLWSGRRGRNTQDSKSAALRSRIGVKIYCHASRGVAMDRLINSPRAISRDMIWILYYDDGDMVRPRRKGSARRRILIVRWCGRRRRRRRRGKPESAPGRLMRAASETKNPARSSAADRTKPVSPRTLSMSGGARSRVVPHVSVKRVGFGRVAGRVTGVDGIGRPPHRM